MNINFYDFNNILYLNLMICILIVDNELFNKILLMYSIQKIIFDYYQFKIEFFICCSINK